MSDSVDIDPEGAMRDYLRADAGVAALFGTRVLFGYSGDVWPQAIVTRVGGGDDGSEAPIDQPLLQIEVAGSLKNKTITTAAKNAVRVALRSLRGGTRPDEDRDTVLDGASVIGDVWLPDPATDRPRYILTVAVTARAFTAA